MKIGIVGIGLMGNNICLRLINEGFEVGIYNRTTSKLKSLEKKSAKIFNTPKEIANNSDFIIISITNFEAVNTISFQKDGLQETENTNIVIADFSTLSPKESIYCYRKFMNKNISMLSIPVMGGPNAALEGHLIPIVCGEEIIFKKIKNILKKLGNPVFYIGNKEGSSNAIKLALNLNIGLLAIALSEGLLLSNRYEIDPTLYLEIFNSTNFKTGMSEIKGPKVINDDYHPSFYLKNMRKDLGLVMAAAQEKELCQLLTLHFNYTISSKINIR